MRTQNEPHVLEHTSSLRTLYRHRTTLRTHTIQVLPITPTKPATKHSKDKEATITMGPMTQTQQAQIHCVKNNHARYVSTFFGYVHCGRCGEQIGDTLGGTYPMDKCAIVGCPKPPSKCKHCGPIFRSLSKMDKEIFKRLRKYRKETKLQEEILQGINFEMEET